MSRRYKHSLSSTKLLSCDMGELVPIGLTEVLPGDSIQQATSALVRAAPLLAPVMHPVHVRIHHWFVPNRLIWDDFEKFITGGPTGFDVSVFPTITMPGGGGAAQGSLADYLGVPPGVASLQVSALPFRAYVAIFNEWYRDQDLVPALPLATSSGPDATTSTALQVCAWEKDYFTSARPWEQKGPNITVPLGTSANVRTQATEHTTTAQPGLRIRTDAGGAPNANVALSTGVSGNFGAANSVAAASNVNLYPTNLFADLSTASAVTVNVLRQALALQRYQEARARYGSRYVEYLRYLGVASSDARLQRPEYLGGGSQTIQFSEVLQTAEGTNPVGRMRGHGISSIRSNRYRRFFEEHGFIVSLLSVRPKTIYASGLARHWNRRVKEDFWQKELEFIGQQPIRNKEVYAASATPDATFGFQDRYDEYRRAESSIAGEFRGTSLNFWHMARIFATAPALNQSFVECVPTERSFAVPSEDVIYVYARHSIQARRLVCQVGKSFIY